MAFKMFALALVLAAALTVGSAHEIDDKSFSILENHIKSLKAEGLHEKEEVPEELRGEKMTVENLHKFFSSEAQVKVVHHETGEELVNTWSAVEQAAEPEGAELKKVQTSRKLLQGADFETIVRTGKEVWQFLEDNKPVKNVDVTAQVSAIPKACQNDWMSMAGFKSHTSYDVVWQWVNGFKTVVVELKYSWVFKSEGTCSSDGKTAGSYIRDAGVVAKSSKCAWGYTCNAEGKAFAPYNTGSHASPIAALDLQVNLEHSNILTDKGQTCRVTVQGDGKGRSVSCDSYPYFNLRY